MRALITGSSGHLGEALVRCAGSHGFDVVGLDARPSEFTAFVGSVCDAELVRAAMQDVDVVIHSATLHKPHIATHSTFDFIDTNVIGAATILEESVRAGLRGVVFTSTTSAFGSALRPTREDGAAWIDEDLAAIPKNIYGATKVHAEDLCELFHRRHRLPVIILRVARFFPERDEKNEARLGLSDENIKANDFLYRRVDLSDAVSAHYMSARKLAEVGFAKYVVCATTPFDRVHRKKLMEDAPQIVASFYPDYPEIYARYGWKMQRQIDRIYVNRSIREDIGWTPEFCFGEILRRLDAGLPAVSELSLEVGHRGY